MCIRDRNGGPAGDLLISVTVRPHEFFKRDGTSVYLEHPVTFLQATLGAELEIPTIDGKVKWSLPAGTQPGTTFRLRGKGIPSVNGRGRGGAQAGSASSDPNVVDADYEVVDDDNQK